MKVAILTITDGANYGNRLQNYALQEVLKAMGHEVETIKRRTYRDKVGIDFVKDKVKICIKKCIGKKYRQYYYQRKKKFAEFNKKYIKFSKITLSNNTAPRSIEKKYDYFVCGSDQIWNARIRIVKEDLDNYLASFADSSKKIAYAASFGANDIPSEYKGLFSKQLKTFKAIGVREYSGLQIIHELCGCLDSTVVLDPTMLLTSEQWKKISRKPDFCNSYEPYIVTYFLGGRDLAINEYMEKMAYESNCKIINLENEFISESKITEPDLYKVAPDEFIWLIENSQCVLTDSFHATVFSIIFHKKFCVFERNIQEQGNDMSSRITTLLGYFGLEKFHDNINHPSIIPLEYDSDYVEGVLEQKRKESFLFLRMALT